MFCVEMVSLLRRLEGPLPLYTVKSLYSGHSSGNEILSFIEGWPYLRGLICTKRVHMGLSKVAFIERGVLTSGVAFIKGFHYNHFSMIPNSGWAHAWNPPSLSLLISVFPNQCFPY